ncbi:MAG: hypothetical protein E7029_02420 [Planctomycetaceae bacterium]|nr:hypothetical protein [Planctomycetaceae bacterium]
MPPGREFAEFGRLLVRAGYVVLCVEAYPYNLLEDPTGTAQKQGFRWRQRAAETLLAEDSAQIPGPLENAYPEK